MVTPQTDWAEPRSTSSHCGSENADDQRVPVLPSVAAAAVKDAFSSDEAVVGWLSATLVVPQVAALAGAAAVYTPDTRPARIRAVQARSLASLRCGRRRSRLGLRSTQTSDDCEW